MSALGLEPELQRTLVHAKTIVKVLVSILESTNFGVRVGVRKEKRPLWVILAPGPRGNGRGQFLGRGPSRALGAPAASKAQAVARSAGDG